MADDIEAVSCGKLRYIAVVCAGIISVGVVDHQE
jgi:hypothetical protein